MLTEDLRRWFKEKWTAQDGSECGDYKGRGRVKCRPSRRVSEKSPEPWGEMSKEEKKKAVEKKQEAHRKGKQFSSHKTGKTWDGPKNKYRPKKKKEMNEDVIRTGESPQEYRGRLLRQISNGNISSMDNHDRVHGALAYIDSIKQHYEGRDRNINLVVAGTGTDGGAKIGFVVQGIHPKGNHIIAQPAAKGAARHPRLEEIPIKNIYGLQMSTYPNMKIEHRETLRRLMDFRGLREMMENFKQLIFEKRKTEGKPYKGFKKGKNHPEGGLSRSEAKRQGIHAGIETKDEAKRKGGFGKLSKKTQSRRKSFCARMCGMKKRRTSSKTARDPKSKINAALRVWGCRCGTNESYEPDINMIMESKNNPTDKKLWSQAKALARKKFDVYPSAYANAWSSKWYKKRGGGWSKSSTNESYLPEEIVNRENAGTMTDQEREEVARLAPKLKNVKVIKKGDSLKNARHRYAVYLVLQKRRKQKGKKQEKGRKKKKG